MREYSTASEKSLEIIHFLQSILSSVLVIKKWVNVLYEKSLRQQSLPVIQIFPEHLHCMVKWVNKMGEKSLEIIKQPRNHPDKKEIVKKNCMFPLNKKK